MPCAQCQRPHPAPAGSPGCALAWPGASGAGSREQPTKKNHRGGLSKLRTSFFFFRPGMKSYGKRVPSIESCAGFGFVRTIESSLLASNIHLAIKMLFHVEPRVLNTSLLGCRFKIKTTLRRFFSPLPSLRGARFQPKTGRPRNSTDGKAAP